MTTLSEKNKAYLVGALYLGVLVALLFFVGEIILPFVLALFIAYLLNPVILRLQKKIKNRSLAVTALLASFILIVLAILFFFGSHIVTDAKRMVGAIETFAVEHEDQLQDIKNSVVQFGYEINENVSVEDLTQSLDTLSLEENKESIVSAIESVYNYFQEPSEVEEEPEPQGWSVFGMVFSTLFYLLLILYSFEYFEGKYTTYVSNLKPVNSRLTGIWDDYKTTFVTYFRQRMKVVLLNAAIFILAFSVMDLPGAILIGLLTGLLSYASHFHYLSLPLAAIGCWILSVEHDTSFFLYFGILLAVYIIISILDEFVYFDKIMHSVNGMNPAVIVLAFTLWIAAFGGFVGTILALPLTQFILIYLDKVATYSNEKIKPKE